MPKLTKTEADLISKSGELGKQNFDQSNSIRIVHRDAEMMKLLSSVKGEKNHKLRMKMMEAWYHEWDKANIGAAANILHGDC